jgi:hypothetical protein
MPAPTATTPPRVPALPARNYQRRSAALPVALSDLPLELLRKLDLGRPMLNHADERERAACTGVFNGSFDRAANPSRVRTETIPAEAQLAAQAYCAGCPILQECGAYADTNREEGLHGGGYRVKVAGQYRVFELL